MNEDQMIDQARYRDFKRAEELGAYTPIEQILGKVSDHYALMAQLAALVEALANMRGCQCDCVTKALTEHAQNCPVVEARELVRKMASM